ncbi:MAG: HPr family phosphocarrier protein [Deltaproteobacteria bacterium]|nr:HPr family phosphocarrier protein [Deltaproteobacteria bacterium]MBW2537477.1 HPr family phosphocarrier protein [Deltaproteobacteria bacterium]
MDASFVILNARGLHARAASQLVQLASKFPCQIQLSAPGVDSVNAKSVMGVLLLCGAKGTLIQVQAEGDRAAEAVAAIGELIANRFGETE